MSSGRHGDGRCVRTALRPDSGAAARPQVGHTYRVCCRRLARLVRPRLEADLPAGRVRHAARGRLQALPPPPRSLLQLLRVDQRGLRAVDDRHGSVG